MYVFHRFISIDIAVGSARVLESRGREFDLTRGIVGMCLVVVQTADQFCDFQRVVTLFKYALKDFSTIISLAF